NQYVASTIIIWASVAPGTIRNVEANASHKPTASSRRAGQERGGGTGARKRQNPGSPGRVGLFLLHRHLLGERRSLLLSTVLVSSGLLLTGLLAHRFRRFVAHDSDDVP